MNTNGLDSFGLHSLLRLHHVIVTQFQLSSSQSTTNRTVEWLKKEIRKYITRLPNTNPKPKQLEAIFEIANGFKPNPRRTSTWYMKKLYCFIGCVSRYNISHMSELHYCGIIYSVGDEVELKNVRYRIVQFTMDQNKKLSAILTQYGTNHKSVRRLDRLQHYRQVTGKTLTPSIPRQPSICTVSSSSTPRRTGTHTIDTIDKSTSRKRSYFCVYGCGQKRHKGRCKKTVHKRKPTTNKITSSTQQVIVQSPRRKRSTVDHKSKKPKLNTPRPLLCSRGCGNPPHRGNCRKTSKPSTPRRLCSRGCGKPPHRGNCKKASKPSTPRPLLCSRGCGKPPHRGNCRKKK